MTPRALAISVALLLPACNDQAPTFPFLVDADANTDASSDAQADDAPVDAGDTAEDDAGDASRDGTGDDASPDAPAPDTDHDTTPDATTPDADHDTTPDATGDASTGDTAVRPDTDPGDAGHDTDPGACTPGDSCDDGLGFCYAPVGCESEPVCAPSCEAEDLVNVCTCEGVVARVAPGCSGTPYAYVLADWDQQEYFVGAECDPSEEGPLRYGLELVGERFDFLTGLDIYVRVPSNWDDSYVVDERFEIPAESFVHDVALALDTDLFGWFVNWYVDADSDGRCDPEVDFAFSTFVSNPFGPGPVRAEISPAPEFEDELGCDAWNDTPP